ncbi:putative sulfate exporter family transporter [Sandaracinobacter sp. RS1-74]|uniref:YeiH family protein n=1 Tax=Sandaracinobacteroides sayramensis TaxID=2913411 RepID=UPI001EDAAD04|nr:putative sulfate exporter family transporter [Sandaracinobacteroides sayramensis]MCG2840492.1 putative sulfate exporter family transporter [Sandaracinobacteroides sayramensis]
MTEAARRRFPSAFAGGLLLCALIAKLALLASAFAGLPAMLVVLALGMATRLALPRLTAWAAPGIGFTSATVLRAGVALLGFRVVADDLLALGWPALALVLASVAATVLGGIGIARLLRQPADLATVSATSVAICGASAALAASAAVPRRPGLERETVLVILIVSLMSTAAMLGYPLIARALDFSPGATALLLGGAIHDVAQVAGAGFAVSEEVGVRSVTVKMIRVACLLPVVTGIAFAFLGSGDAQAGRRWRAVRPPTFLVLFFLFAVVTSTALLPPQVSQLAGTAAAWLLTAAVGAIGLKTGFGELRAARPTLALTLLAQTGWQLLVVTALILWIGA